ncbi:hypothetical protein R1flu_013763 [Riccia fluitans]|uniref:phosphoribosylaminoimidazolesuccinocarboxamide synthase n=1 Tax=Riccia fluitans TaxID=41844 RepID=A0ABD1YHW0_9MARC
MAVNAAVVSCRSLRVNASSLSNERRITVPDGKRLETVSVRLQRYRAAEIWGVCLEFRRRSSRGISLGMMNTEARAMSSTAVPQVELESRRSDVSDAILQCLSNCLTETHLDETVKGLGKKVRGKVRDIYDAGNYLVLVTTYRQSAFDRVLASCISCRICRAVRGYVTGSTSTSLWTVYNKGVRNYCGNELPEGLVKNQRLDENILTPTTKAEDHDMPISGKEIVEQGLMSKEDYEEVSRRALALFAFGQEVARRHGLLLVDTKYEFGKSADGTIFLLDEVLSAL